MSNSAWQSLEKPNMRTGARQLDVSQALAPHFGKGDFNATLIADNAAVLHTLVFAAQALPIRHRPENTGAKQTILFGLESTVIDGFRLRYLTVRPRTNLFWRSQTNANAVKIGDRRRPVVWI